MTELARVETPATLAVPEQNRSIVASFAADLSDAYTIAKALCGTSFVPKEFRGKPEEAAAAILTGAELGIGPMGAMRAIHNIQGRPTLSAGVMRAVVQAHGHSIYVTESSPKRVTVEGRRRGTEDVQSRTWTIEQAKAIGLTSKDTWKNYPEDMLTARATAAVARLVASDLLHGIYTEDEVEDAPAPKREPIRRKAKVETPQPEPELETAPESADPEPEFDDEQKHLAPQSNLAKSMFATLRDFGYTDREDIHAVMEHITGRSVESSKDLTEDEARRIIDSLPDVGANTEGESS